MRLGRQHMSQCGIAGMMDYWKRGLVESTILFVEPFRLHPLPMGSPSSRLLANHASSLSAASNYTSSSPLLSSPLLSSSDALGRTLCRRTTATIVHKHSNTIPSPQPNPCRITQNSMHAASAANAVRRTWLHLSHKGSLKKCGSTPGPPAVCEASVRPCGLRETGCPAIAFARRLGQQLPGMWR
jgi:hypothetical protein